MPKVPERDSYNAKQFCGQIIDWQEHATCYTIKNCINVMYAMCIWTIMHHTSISRFCVCLLVPYPCSWFTPTIWIMSQRCLSQLNQTVLRGILTCSTEMELIYRDNRFQITDINDIVNSCYVS